MSAPQIAIVTPLLFMLATACGDSSSTNVEPLEQSSEKKTAASFSNEPATLGWQARSRTLVAAGSLSPLAAGRIYAALSVAQYRAVLATNNQQESDGLLQENGFGEGGRSLFEAQRGAVAGASARVLSFFFPSAAAAIEAQVNVEADAGPGGVHPHFKSGLAIGRVAGDASVAWVTADGFTRPWTGSVPTGPGMWIANGPPVGATLGAVTPYFMTSGSQFRPASPPAYLSPAFNVALNEVHTITQNRTPAQVADALSWNSGPGTPTPPGYWNAVAQAHSMEYQLDETKTARVFATMHAAVFDALIACWDAKYFYWLLRPTQANPAITLALPLPNHPSYPSGHSCVSAAAGTVLTHFFPDDASEFSTAVTAAGLSRIVAGIHYRFDITAGNAIGNAVGQLALNSSFQ